MDNIAKPPMGLQLPGLKDKANLGREEACLYSKSTLAQLGLDYIQVAQIMIFIHLHVHSMRCTLDTSLSIVISPVHCYTKIMIRYPSLHINHTVIWYRLS